MDDIPEIYEHLSALEIPPLVRRKKTTSKISTSSS
jgi:hypothetical protein